MGKSKSCIDLMITNQPHLFLETGVHPTLNELYHHQMAFTIISAYNLASSPHNRKFWYNDRANIPAIRRSIEICDLQGTLQELKYPNLQVRTLNSMLANIFSKFIPKEIKTVRLRQAPWIT